MSSSEELSPDEQRGSPLIGIPSAAAARCGRRSCFAAGFSSALAIAIAVGVLAVTLVLPGLSGGGPPSCPTAILPDAPAVVSVDATISSLKINWRASEMHGGQLLRYDVSTNRSGKTMEIEAGCLGGGTSCDVVGLEPSLTLAFAIRAVSTSGIGNASDVYAASTRSPTAPDAPLAVRAQFEGETFIEATWESPPLCSADTLKYALEVCPLQPSPTPFAPSGVCGGTAVGHTCGNWSLVASSGESSSLRTRHILGLDAGRHYCVRVRALNSLGLSPWSSPALMRTARRGATVPGQPTAPAASALVDRLTLGWTLPDDGGSPILRFDASATPFLPDGSRAPPPATSCTVDGSSLNCSVLALAANTSYVCRVRATNSKGEGPWSNGTVSRTLPAESPGPPEPPQPSTGDPMLIRWKGADPRGAPITEYTLQLDDWWEGQPAGHGYRTIYNGTSSQYEASRTDDRLLPASRYALRARAHNAGGDGKWSARGELLTPGAGACGNAADVKIFDKHRVRWPTNGSSHLSLRFTLRFTVRVTLRSVDRPHAKIR